MSPATQEDSPASAAPTPEIIDARKNGSVSPPSAAGIVVSPLVTVDPFPNDRYMTPPATQEGSPASAAAAP